MVRRSWPESFLIIVISLSLLVLTVGAATAAFTGSNKPLELRPWIAFVGRTFGWLQSSAEEASQPDTDDRSFAEIAQDSASEA